MTEQDRWWLAYCVLGAALVVRAPQWIWAACVVLIWGVLLAILSVTQKPISPVTLIKGLKRRKKDPPNAVSPATPPAKPVGLFTPQETTRQFAPVGEAAEPPTEVIRRVPMQGAALEQILGEGEARSSGRVIITLSGTLWTTDTLLDEIQATIRKAKERGDTT